MTGQTLAGGGVVRQLAVLPWPDPSLTFGQLRNQMELQDSELPQMTGHTSVSDSCRGPEGCGHVRWGCLEPLGSGSWDDKGAGQSLLEGGPLDSTVSDRRLSTVCCKP